MDLPPLIGPFSDLILLETDHTPKAVGWNVSQYGPAVKSRSADAEDHASLLDGQEAHVISIVHRERGLV